MAHANESSEEIARLEATETRLGFRPIRNYGVREGAKMEEMEIGLPFDWTPLFTTLLLGARDEHSPLSLLRGKEEDIVQHVCKLLLYNYKEGAVTITIPAYAASRIEYAPFIDERRDQDADDVEVELVMNCEVGQCLAFNALVLQTQQVELRGRFKKDRPKIAFTPCNTVNFPEPTGININMMPFVMGDRKTLPRELQPYYDTIISKCPIAEEEKGETMYLTVQESFVEATGSQRRPGLHIEAPSASAHYQSGAGLEHSWGVGMSYSPDELKGGLYIASNMSNTTAVWDALIGPKLGAVDTHGGIEHLRPFIGKGKKLPAGLLVWLTDHTPHEALPQEKDGYRQFFRLVTEEVSVWFAAQSTPNPKISCTVPCQDYRRE